MIDLCREHRCHVHIVHLSSADALPMIEHAANEGLPLTVETCPHYLTFAAEEIPDGDPRYKCAPPIRERENRERLWEGLRQGLIDTIGSDHSPAPPELKHLDSGDVFRAWGGIASLQLALPGGLDRGVPARVRDRRPGAMDGRPPRRTCSGSARKGAIAPGRDADLVVFDPEASFTVDSAALHHRHKATPYEGRSPRGSGRDHVLERPRRLSSYRSLRRTSRGTTALLAASRGRRDRLHEPGTDQRLESDEASAIISGAAADRRAGPLEMARLRPFESEAALARGRRAHLVGACRTPTGSRPLRRIRGSATRAHSRPNSRRPPPGRPPNRRASPARPSDVLCELADGNPSTRRVSALSSSSAPPASRPRKCSTLLRRRLHNSAALMRSRSPPPSNGRSPGFAWRRSHHEPDHDPRARHRGGQARRGNHRGRRDWPEPDRWAELARGVTDANGRIAQFTPPLAALKPGPHRLRFVTAAYFTAAGVHGFYPEVCVIVQIDDPAQHYHIPLLLSPFGYTTYRGS